MSRLDGYDIAIMLDRSGSMATADCPNHKTRWDYARENVEAVTARAAKIDSDGIDIVVFGSQVKKYPNTTPEKIQQIYAEVEPLGGTATDAALEALLTPDWFSARKAGTNKPLIVIVFTDGEPNNRAAVAKVITNAANSIEKDEDLAISFVQIGKDASAQAYLAELDDNLNAKFDIVDTKSMDELENLGVVGLLEAALDD